MSQKTINISVTCGKSSITYSATKDFVDSIKVVENIAIQCSNAESIRIKATEGHARK